MGDISFGDFSSLFTNLNKLFGGTEYYGVHAPPFIDLFEEFLLSARPIGKNGNVAIAIQKAISSDHLVMAWIKIGYGKPIDVALSYGITTPVIRGEHVLMIYGYDQEGVFVMDPGNGGKRHIFYQDLINSMQEFPMPLLEVYPSSKATSFEVVPESTDSLTGLPRNNLRILVRNASGKAGLGNEVASLFREFGYKIAGVESKEADELDVSIEIKKEMHDYLYLLRRDLNLLSYRIATSSSDLIKEEADAIITIGR
ncbi:MAG: C39 family peptidase [Candidatus Levybacteria bacterium]|nr:C39 family peptidase [Candidatus Levybacteria bacterium]